MLLSTNPDLALAKFAGLRRLFAPLRTSWLKAAKNGKIWLKNG